MSRKHYREIAKAISDEVKYGNASEDPRSAVTASNIARSLAEMFKRDNPRFDRERFYAACGLDANGRVSNDDQQREVKR